MSRLRPIRRTMTLVALALTATGCAELRGRTREADAAASRRADARKRWDEMRGAARVQVAERHLAAGRLNEAEEEVRQALMASPDHPNVLLVAARLWLERGETAKARELLTQAAARSEDPAIDYWSGIVAQRYGDRAEALACYRRAARKAPLRPEYVLAEAEMLVESGRRVEALALIESRLRDFDGDVPLRLLAARLCRALGLVAPAVERCREAARLSKEDAVCRAELGMMLAWAAQPEEALVVLRPLVEAARAPTATTLEQDAVTPDVVFALAQCCAALERWSEARWALQPVMDAGRPEPAAATLYARAAWMGGEEAAAERALAALPARHRPPEVLLLAGHLALRRGDLSAAAAAAQEALRVLQRRPTHRPVEPAPHRSSPAEAPLHDGGGDRAAASDDAALAYCLLGQAAERQQRPADAARAYRASLETAPDMALARALLDRLEAEALPAGGVDR